MKTGNVRKESEADGKDRKNEKAEEEEDNQKTMMVEETMPGISEE